MRSLAGSGLIERDDTQPLEIPSTFLDILANALATRVAEQLADQLAGRQDGSPWMTFQEAVQYTRIPAGTFRKLSANGTITAHGGKRKIYHRQELDTALQGLGCKHR